MLEFAFRSYLEERCFSRQVLALIGASFLAGLAAAFIVVRAQEDEDRAPGLRVVVSGTV